MSNSSFNPEQQNLDMSDKVVAGLERISEVFKKLLWDKAKTLGLSPIQIQILIFINFHKESLCRVSHLAKEFNLTKPTISDAVRALEKKGFIIKDYSSIDSRSYNILLSQSGKDLVLQTANFSNPIKKQLDKLPEKQIETIFDTLSTVIFNLNQQGVLSVQRTCYACKFYNSTNGTNYCNLLQKELLEKEIRIDCPEFEELTN